MHKPMGAAAVSWVAAAGVNVAHEWLALAAVMCSLVATFYAVRVSQAKLAEAALRRALDLEVLCEACRKGQRPAHCPVPLAERPGECPGKDKG